MSTTPEPKVKQKRIREPDCHKKGGWVAIGTFVVTHPSEKVPILCNTRYMWFGRRLTKIQGTTRPEKVWPQVWTKNGKAAQKREKQEWAIEKPKLDIARRLRVIYFMDPENGEYKDTIKNGRKMLEVPLDAAMSCKKGTRETIFFRKLKREVVNPTRFQKPSIHVLRRRQCLESSLPKGHEDRFAGKGKNSMTHYNLVHKFISCASSDENSGCESSSGQGMEEA